MYDEVCARDDRFLIPSAHVILCFSVMKHDGEMLLPFELFCFPSDSKWQRWPEGLGDMATGNHFDDGIFSVFLLLLNSDFFFFIFIYVIPVLLFCHIQTFWLWLSNH